MACNTTKLINLAGKFAVLDPAQRRRLRLALLAQSNGAHCSGATYWTSFAAWRTLTAAANTALGAATPFQCELAYLRMLAEGASTVTVDAVPTDAQMQTMLQTSERLTGMGEDDLAKMETFLLCVQSEVVQAL